MKKALVCGAGKVGRGFLAQLLHRSGFLVYFLDSDPRVVDLLNASKSYRVNIAGAADESETIPVEQAYTPDDRVAVGALLREVDLVFSCVGARNLDPVSNFLAPLLAERDEVIDWLICENAHDPAATIRSVIDRIGGDVARRLSAKRLGLVETQVLRSVGEVDLGTGGELDVTGSNWWTLPADGDAFVGTPPEIIGLEPKANFAAELIRKIYTFNGLNGPLAYFGYANGYRILHEAARAPELQPFVREIQEESAHGLVREFGFEENEHREFQALAFKKYRDTGFVDTLERHARDSARKLGPEERLLGPARLCLKHGREPVAYARAIAAAISYDGSNDPGTQSVQETLRKGGVRLVLREISSCAEGASLCELIESAWNGRSYLVGRA